MKFIRTFLVLSFVLLSIGNTAFAQTPAADTGIDFIEKKTCGFADDPDAIFCCKKTDFDKEVLKPIEGVLNKVPEDPNAPKSNAVDVLNEVNTVNPMRDRMQQSCYTGLEKKVRTKNTKTGKWEMICICSSDKFTKQQTTGIKLKEICNKYIKDTKEHGACLACAGEEKIMTGLGCIPTKFSKFVTDFLLKTGIGFAGMFSLGCIIYSAIMIQTSQGNTEKISSA
ncbi:MAG: hypothetical protein WBO77_04620, partial [Microgenomates group bacterium]